MNSASYDRLRKIYGVISHFQVLPKAFLLRTCIMESRTAEKADEAPQIVTRMKN